MLGEKEVNKKQAKIAKVMHEYKQGTLHSGKDPKGPKQAPLAKSQKQAIAIAIDKYERGVKAKRK